MGQKVLDRQPNWLVPPTRWRAQACDHQPVRYRTPTPYPKEDRKRMKEPSHATRPATRSATIHIPEKTLLIETPVVSHVEVAQPYRKQAGMQPLMTTIPTQNPQAALKITWDMSPRRNRFERVP
jgi:hypothetical protein